MKVANIEFPERIELNNINLRLNGAGVRNKFFIDLYALALYSAKSITEGEEAVSGKTIRALRIVITTPIITNQLVTQNIRDGMKRSAGSVYKLIAEHIEEIIQVFDKQPIKTRDYFDILYEPKLGMTVYRNGVYASGPQLGEELRDTVFGNWLSKHPRDLRLKRNMLKGY